MGFSFQEGLSDIDSALVIARTIKDHQTEGGPDQIDHKMSNLIGLLIHAREHFIEAGPVLTPDKEGSAALPGGSDFNNTATRQLPRVTVTDEELKILLGK